MFLLLLLFCFVFCCCCCFVFFLLFFFQLTVQGGSSIAAHLFSCVDGFVSRAERKTEVSQMVVFPKT